MQARGLEVALVLAVAGAGVLACDRPRPPRIVIEHAPPVELASTTTSTGATVLRPTLASTSPSRAASPSPSSIRGPHVPAGTVVALELSKTVGTDVSGVGEPFTAVVRETLVARAGEIVVAAGALVRGVVAQTVRAGEPYLVLQFQAIETSRGAVPLDARLVGGKAITIPLIGDIVPPVGQLYDDKFFRPGAVDLSDLPSPWDQPGAPIYRFEAPWQIRLLAGAPLRVELTRPLALPER